MTPPTGLVRELRAYDPKLRLRWAERAAEWWIEQPLAKADPELCRALAAKLSGQLDLALPTSTERHALARRIEAVKAAEDGYRAVMFIPAALIHRHDLILRTLYEADITKQGGREGVTRLFDEAAAAFYRERDKERQNYVEGATRDVYDRIQWLSGNRLTTSDMAEGAQTSDALEQHDGFTVRVRKGLVLSETA